METPNTTSNAVRSFVLRQGRITVAQKRALADLSPVYLAEPSRLKTLHDLFDGDRPVILEIGFGMGQSLAQMALSQADCCFVGMEVHAPGVGRLMQQLAQQQLTNVKVVHGDAVAVLQQFVAPASFDGVQLFFPDPWPKKKHHKRRIIQPEFVALLAKVSKPGGFLHLATDWKPYAEHMTSVLQSSSDWLDISALPQGLARIAARPQTRFQQRGQGLGHAIKDMVYQRQ